LQELVDSLKNERDVLAADADRDKARGTIGRIEE